MKNTIERNSKFTRLITFIIDCIILVTCYSIFLQNSEIKISILILYLLFTWFISSEFTKYYQVYRFTKLITILNYILSQAGLFSLFTFAFIAFQKYLKIESSIYFIITSISIISFIKIIIFLTLKYYRKYNKGNNRKVVIVGNNEYSKELKDFFDNKKEYGYTLVKTYINFDKTKLINLLKNNKIDEIYYALPDSDSHEIISMIEFCDQNFTNLKYIPSNKYLLTKVKNIQYYGYIPIIPEHKVPLDNLTNCVIKRLFDIIFSLLVIILILSWLYPILGILIKLESKGNVIFKQKRHGIFYSEFYCYKFRSMKINKDADKKQAIKNDSRVTNIGKFMRKTSIDELPQFFNVLIGNMSVCGPRPHMLSLTNLYEKKIDRYKLRHFVKPGITGIAQTHGSRGEIATHNDLKKRIKYDVFYVENWNILLDIKIIYLTIKNIIQGDEKAL